MLSEIIGNWRDIIYAIVFMVSIPYLASLLALYLKDRLDESIEEENLSFVADQLNCSAYKVFCESGARWNIEKEKIDCDFKEYIQRLIIPYYVRCFVAEIIATLDSNNDPDHNGNKT